MIGQSSVVSAGSPIASQRNETILFCVSFGSWSYRWRYQSNLSLFLSLFAWSSLISGSSETWYFRFAIMRYTEADPMAEQSYAQQFNGNNGEQQSQATGIRQRYRVLSHGKQFFFARESLSGTIVKRYFSLFFSGVRQQRRARRRRRWSCERTRQSFTCTPTSSRCNQKVNRLLPVNEIKLHWLAINGQKDLNKIYICLFFLFASHKHLKMGNWAMRIMMVWKAK